MTCVLFQIMSMFDFTPYAIFILMGRPIYVNIYVCSVIGFVHNFCERFAWFNITRSVRI